MLPSPLYPSPSPLPSPLYPSPHPSLPGGPYGHHSIACQQWEACRLDVLKHTRRLLDILDQLHIDGTVLFKTGLGKTLKAMRKNILLQQEEGGLENPTGGRNGAVGGRGGAGGGGGGGGRGGGGGSSGMVDSFNYHCPEKAESLLQKLISQVKSDNTEKKLNTGPDQGLEGNVIDVPKRADDISCPRGVPGALWEIMKRWVSGLYTLSIHTLSIYILSIHILSIHILSIHILSIHTLTHLSINYPQFVNTHLVNPPWPHLSTFRLLYTNPSYILTLLYINLSIH